MWRSRTHLLLQKHLSRYAIERPSVSNYSHVAVNRIPRIYEQKSGKKNSNFEGNQKKERSSVYKVSLFKVFNYTIVGLTSVYVFINNVGGISRTIGPSMLPTMFIAGDLVWFDALSWKLGKWSPQINDLIVYDTPTDPSRPVIKRVIALEGDVIRRYPPSSLKYEKDLEQDIKMIKIPKGHIWCEGDNHSSSTDSRNYGPIPIGLVRGRITNVIWGTKPLSEHFNGSLKAGFVKTTIEEMSQNTPEHETVRFAI